MTFLSASISFISKVLLAALSYASYRIWRDRWLRLPPGPTPLPLIGNIHQIPSEHSHLMFTEWRKAYGPIIHLSVLGKPLIVLSNSKAALEILEKKGAKYADRPRLVMAGEMVGYEQAVTLAPYDSKLRERRRLIHDSFSSRKLSRYHESGERLARRLMGHLLDEPSNFQCHIKGYVAAVVFNASHGQEIDGHDDPLVLLAEQCGADFCEMVKPGAYLVDVLPFLKYIPDWFPFAGFKRKARLYRDTADKMRDTPFDFVRKQMSEGIAKPSLTADILEAKPARTLEEDLSYRWLTATIYAAGADTSTSLLNSFIMTMALNIDVQRKAQNQLDMVLEPQRLPSFADRGSLPYISALYLELLRLYYPSPTGLPHLAAEDDEYLGYHIPAGAVIIANSWGILHDSGNYSEPDKLLPERFLSPDSPDPRTFAFGYGRRTCPGKYFAEDIIFIAIATILSLFDILPAKSGPPNVEFTANLVIHPKPFECSIKPRSSEAERLIRETSDF
ncbi:hypothetical protein D9756_004267 [Leucocoprinus leucothites]|uniref:Cytochrome P450 n=1 Tax=Leucocoprinus leucothites TaxID=201217 RepID=A0A8H5G001_9AGAR|nr:hypothetical protein D9756_004267 [Leucoagaricus leucothites]